MKNPLHLALVVLLWVCASGEAQAIEVALVGDDSRLPAFERLARQFKARVSEAGGVRLATTADRKIEITVARAGRDPVAVANQLLTADVAFVVLDTTQGPLPIVREHVIVARQAGVPLVGLYFVETAKVDDPELLELEELEMRELLSAYKLKGDEAPIFFDSLSLTHGVHALRVFLISKVSTRAPAVALRMGREFHGTFYLLTEPEGRERNRTVPVVNGSKLDVWIGGFHGPAVVKTSGKHSPGDVPDFVLQLESPAKMAGGDRLLLVRNGMVVGLGVVASIVR